MGKEEVTQGRNMRARIGTQKNCMVEKGTERQGRESAVNKLLKKVMKRDGKKRGKKRGAGERKVIINKNVMKIEA